MKIFLLLSIVFFSTSSLALCVNAEKANLRSKPSAKSRVTWVVERYMPLKRVKRKGAWLQVRDLDRKKHWIHRKLVTDNFRCAAVKVNRANLRSGPGSKFKRTDLAYVRKYAAFKKMDRDDAWLKLRDNYGRTHWAHESTLWEALNYSRHTF